MSQHHSITLLAAGRLTSPSDRREVRADGRISVIQLNRLRSVRSFSTPLSTVTVAERAGCLAQCARTDLRSWITWRRKRPPPSTAAGGSAREEELPVAAPTVVLVHGAFADASSFRALYDALLDEDIPTGHSAEAEAAVGT